MTHSNFTHELLLPVKVNCLIRSGLRSYIFLWNVLVLIKANIVHCVVASLLVIEGYYV